MPRRTSSPKNTSHSFVCATCNTRVSEQNRLLHNVICQRNSANARHEAVRRTPNTAYAREIYAQYAQSQPVVARTTEEHLSNHKILYQLEHQREHEGVYRNVAYINKLSNERAKVRTPPQSPTVTASPALSATPFPFSPSMPNATARDMPRQVLPASRSREATANDVQVFRDCQYCGREYERQFHMTHELQCAFTPFQCARCDQYVRRVDEQYHLHSGCLHGVMNAPARAISTASRAITTPGRQMYASDLRRMAGAAAFALAAYMGSRLASRGSRGGGGGGHGPHITYETVGGNER